MNKRYNYIFFDLDNTLWDFEKNSYRAMLIVFNRFDILSNRVSFDDFFQCYSRHNNLLWESYRKKGITKRKLTKKRFQDTFNELDIRGVDPDRMNTEYLMEMPKQNKLLAGARETLSYLKTKNYQLFVITNGFKEVQYNKLINTEIDGYFTKIFVSEEVKSPKPSYEIFEYAIKSSNAKKSKSLMVGDDWDADIIGASRFGIDSAYLNNSSDKDTAVTNPAIYFINKLHDLMDIL